MTPYIFNLLPSIFNGMKITLFIYFGTLILSIPLGFMGALCYQSKSKLLKKVIYYYTWIIRGTPLLLQLYFVFFALPLFLPINLRNNRVWFGLLTFTINYTAYFIEIFKGGFASIDQGQWDAARMLNMDGWHTNLYIILPQVFRNTVYSVSNEAISLVKDTSLLAAVALPEILMVAKEALSRDSRIDALVLVSIIYLLFTFIVIKTIQYFIKKFRLESKAHDFI